MSKKELIKEEINNRDSNIDIADEWETYHLLFQWINAIKNNVQTPISIFLLFFLWIIIYLNYKWISNINIEITYIWKEKPLTWWWYYFDEILYIWIWILIWIITTIITFFISLKFIKRDGKK